MTNKPEEASDQLVEEKAYRRSGIAEYLQWVLFGAGLALLIELLRGRIISYNPPIIIKSGSFKIGIKKSGSIVGLEGDDFPSGDDDGDLEDATTSYYRYKHENRKVNFVTHLENDTIKKVYPISGRYHFIIKFYFGSCPSNIDDPNWDTLLTGKNKLRLRTKPPLQILVNNNQYDVRKISGGGLCAIILKRIRGGNLKYIDKINFNNDTCIGIDPDIPR